VFKNEIRCKRLKISNLKSANGSKVNTLLKFSILKKNKTTINYIEKIFVKIIKTKHFHLDHGLIQKYD
jgi:hypothetical protein